jgi:hypothetical protein
MIDGMECMQGRLIPLTVRVRVLIRSMKMRVRALMMNTPRPRAIDEKWTFCHSLPIEVVGQAKVQLLIGKVVLMFLDRGLWVVISLGISNRLSAWISLP